MATSGTYTWTLDIGEVIEDAFELAGWEVRTGNDLVTARRSLNLLLTEWANKGVNLWTIEEDNLDMVAGTKTYGLGSETIDVLQVILRNSDNIDIPLTRITLEEYLNMPDKTSQNQPTQFAIQRTASQPVMYMYPTPDSSTDDVIYWKIRYSQDVTTFNGNLDVPRRFIPALVHGLAWKIALKKPSVAVSDDARRLDLQRVAGLKNLYTELFEDAKSEDHDRASLFLRFGPA